MSWISSTIAARVARSVPMRFAVELLDRRRDLREPRGSARSGARPRARRSLTCAAERGAPRLERLLAHRVRCRGTRRRRRRSPPRKSPAASSQPDRRRHTASGLPHRVSSGDVRQVESEGVSLGRRPARGSPPSGAGSSRNAASFERAASVSGRRSRRSGRAPRGRRRPTRTTRTAAARRARRTSGGQRPLETREQRRATRSAARARSSGAPPTPAASVESL